jgi:hypothetical protein
MEPDDALYGAYGAALNTISPHGTLRKPVMRYAASLRFKTSYAIRWVPLAFYGALPMCRYVTIWGPMWPYGNVGGRMGRYEGL